jgi:hypothetical protein
LCRVETTPLPRLRIVQLQQLILMHAYAGMAVGLHPLSGIGDTCCNPGNPSCPSPTGRSTGANAVGVGTIEGPCRCVTTPGPSEPPGLRLQRFTAAPVLHLFLEKLGGIDQKSLSCCASTLTLVCSAKPLAAAQAGSGPCQPKRRRSV